MRRKVGSIVADTVCAFLAYVAARWIWITKSDLFRNLHWELLTFAGIYLLLRLILKGWRLAREGKKAA
jgi:hypothetical protein